MVLEILIILFIIILCIIFLIFFKAWHLHVIFKIYNLSHELSIKINFLFIQININKITSDTTLIFSLKFASHIKQITSIHIKSDKPTKKNQEDKSKEQEDNSNKNKELFYKLKDISILLLDSKEDFYHIIILILNIIKFDNSHMELNIGLGDNNLTIKLCNVLWSLSAPLYALNFQLLLSPKINESLIQSKGNIKFNLKLVNLIKILFILIKNKNFREIVKKVLR